MGRKYTHDELNKCSRGELVTMVLAMQDQMETLNENIEKLIEQVRTANSYRFDRHTEKLEAITSISGICLLNCPSAVTRKEI